MVIVFGFTQSKIKKSWHKHILQSNELNFNLTRTHNEILFKESLSRFNIVKLWTFKPLLCKAEHCKTLSSSQLCVNFPLKLFIWRRKEYFWDAGRTFIYYSLLPWRQVFSKCVVKNLKTYNLIINQKRKNTLNYLLF